MKHIFQLGGCPKGMPARLFANSGEHNAREVT